jgi:hypothetical protein
VEADDDLLASVAEAYRPEYLRPLPVLPQRAAGNGVAPALRGLLEDEGFARVGVTHHVAAGRLLGGDRRAHTRRRERLGHQDDLLSQIRRALELKRASAEDELLNVFFDQAHGVSDSLRPAEAAPNPTQEAPG